MLNENQGYYIQIPFSDLKLGEFAEIIKNNFLKNNKLKYYSLRDYRTYIVWLKYEEYIKEIENSFILENIKEINPYGKIDEEIQINRLGMIDNYFNKGEIKLYEILRSYNQYEKYENENSYFCEKCKKNVIAVKKTFLYSLPEVSKKRKKKL